MKDYIFLTNLDFIRSNSWVSNNLQDKYIQSALREAQDIDLQSVLGSKLYKRLQELVGDGNIIADENYRYKLLLDECQYYLMYATITKIVLSSSIKLDNFGANQATDEHLQALPMKDLFTLENNINEKSNFYKKRLQDYLTEHKDNFKELKENKCTDVKPNRYASDSCSIFLGGVRGKRK